MFLFHVLGKSDSPGFLFFIYPGPWEREKSSQDQELDLVCIQTAMTLA